MKQKNTKSWATLLKSSLNDTRALPQGEGWVRADVLKAQLKISSFLFQRMCRAGTKAKPPTIEVATGSDFNAKGSLTSMRWYRLL